MRRSARRTAIDKDGEAHTLNTRAASRRLLGNLKTARLGGLHVWTQPNSWHHFMADHIITFAVLPLSADRTLLRTSWLVHKDAIEGVDYDIDNLTAVWVATNEQDGALVARTQQGAADPAYRPGPYSPHTEILVDQFINWYIQRMRAGLAIGPAVEIAA
jgi:glycine betaine catabolism A